MDDSGGSKDKPAGFEPPPTSAEPFIELLERFKSKVVQRLDVGTAEARVEAERATIMEQLAKTGTVAEVRGGEGPIIHGHHITWAPHHWSFQSGRTMRTWKKSVK